MAYSFKTQFHFSAMRNLFNYMANNKLYVTFKNVNYLHTHNKFLQSQ